MPQIPLQLCLAAREITDTRVRPGGEWVSAVVSEPAVSGALTRLVMWPVSAPERETVLLLDPMPIAGRGLSGGVHVWDTDGKRVFVVTKSDGIVAIPVTNDTPGPIRRLPFDIARSWSTPVFDYMNRSIYAIADWKQLWGCHADSGEPWMAYEAKDFAIDACAGSDGMCVTWERPHMPWTQSTVYPEPVTSGVAVQQPRFSTTGNSFGYIDDRSGVNNVRILADGIVPHDVVIEDECEHGGPTWGPGQRTWCFNTDGTKVAYTRNENGFGSLWVFDRLTEQRHMIGRAVHGCVSWEENTLCALRSGARTPQQVVVYDVSQLETPQRTIVARGGDELWASSEIDAELVEPSVHEAEHDGVVVPYRLYRSSKHPYGLIVWVHGGPIDQWQVTFRSRLAFWISRGWSIAVVDHRGSTGYGRAFLTSLHGGWGANDSDDTCAVLLHVQRVFGYRPERTVLMGGSAGGLTALNTAVCMPDHVAGMVLSYPVVDLAELMRGDDPFETHYMPELLGATGPDDPILHQRTPLTYAHRIAEIPTLIFHGDLDKSVPLIHSQRLKNVVRAAGGEIQLEVMEGEGHGFKESRSIIREMIVTESFLSRF